MAGNAGLRRFLSPRLQAPSVEHKETDDRDAVMRIVDPHHKQYSSVEPATSHDCTAPSNDGHKAIVPGTKGIPSIPAKT